MSHSPSNPYHLPPAIRHSLPFLPDPSSSSGTAMYPTAYSNGKSTPADDGSLPVDDQLFDYDDHASASVEPEPGSSTNANAKAGPSGAAAAPGEEPKKKSTRGSRACTVCRKLKMRCVGAEEGPPCKRCKNGGHECIFEESQRGRRSNRKTDAMAKSLKSMEAKLESVLASISNPGLMAGSGGLVTDPTLARAPLFPLDSGPGGAEGRGDMHVGVSMDAGMVASALEQIRQGGAGGMGAVSAGLQGGVAPGSGSGGATRTQQQQQQQHARPSAMRADTSESAIRRRDPITLPSIAASTELQSSVRFEGIGGGVGVGAFGEPTRQHPQHGAHGGMPRPPSLGGSSQSAGKGSPMEWSGVGSEKTGQTDGSPRLHSLPDNTLNPLGLLAEASLRNTRKRPVDLTEVYDVTSDAHADEPKGKGKGKGKRPAQDAPGEEGAGERDGKKKKVELGMANRNYFAPGPMNILPLRRIVIEQRMPPALLEEKILTVEEVVELFEIFFTHCHRQAPFLDPDIHTPAATGSRSPFLFTCICTVAARYYTKRTDDLYRKCLRTAKRVAFDVMTKGYKSTEICQGFLLLCCWNQPAERFEEERTYQFSGIAIRMATDLNLHRKTIAQLPPDVSDETRVLYERELLNRERAWLYSFICDRSVSTQMGKPYSIPKEDYIIRSASTWHTQPGALPSDAGLSAMVEMHRIVGRMIDVLYSDTRSVSGLNAHLDYPLLMRAFLQQLDQWRSDWGDEMAYRDQDEPSRRIRSQMRDFYHAYYRLFLLSFAVQHALEDPGSTIDLPGYCVLCFEAAERMISILRDFLGPAGILRYAMDSTFVYASYAAVFLLKLVSPTFASFIDEDAAMRLVRETAETLEKSAVDDQHTPALYGSFLRALIDNKLHGPRTAANSRAPTRPGSPNLAMPSSAGLSYTLNGGNSIGLESFLRSRATSPAPSAFPGDLPAFGFGAAEGEMGDAAVHDALTMDSMLSDGGFWSQMLMPGFGGPLASLSGGTGTVFAGNPADPFSMTPFHSRPASPTQPSSSSHAFPPTFDFHLSSSSSSTGGGGDFGLSSSSHHSVHAPVPTPAPAEPTTTTTTTTTNGVTATSAATATAADVDGEVHFALPQATPLSGGGGGASLEDEGQGQADGAAAAAGKTNEKEKEKGEPATNGNGNGNGEAVERAAAAEGEVKVDDSLAAASHE
ncbi:hypothetical protein JCM5296_007001 [Sporobolomyces johnsonii]